MAVPPQANNPYGPPHLAHETPFWAPLAKPLEEKLLSWTDVHQMSVFGRNGYFVHNYLFASVPVQEPVLEVWLRLEAADAETLEKHPKGSRHVHPVPGWVRLRVDDEKDAAEALSWLEQAWRRAAQVWEEGTRQHARPKPEGGVAMPLGVPIDLVPEPTGKPDHKIPQGPDSGRFVTGLAVEGAMPQPTRGG